jgi:hypothetical protein
MKKLALTIAMAGFVASSYGQGYVTVAGNQVNQTNTTKLTTSWTGGSLGTGTLGSLGNVASGQSYNVALLTSTSLSPLTALYGSGASLSTTWLDTGLLGHNNTFAGRLSIGSDVLANNAAIGVNQSFLLVAWSANLGASWSAVSATLASGAAFSQAGYLGWSVVAQGQAGPPPTGTPLIIQTTAGGIINSGMSLLAVPVPEPTTMALIALGGASLVLFRRRK